MKYSFYIYVFAIVTVTLTMVSCKPDLTEEININAQSNISLGLSSPEFEASIDDDFSHKCCTRAAISASPNEDGTYSLTWESSDEISISDGTNTAIYSTQSTGSYATFTKKSGSISNTATKYVAYFPATLTPQNQKLPATQDYVAGNVKNYPMYAESSDKTLAFKNLCGIIRVSLKNTDTERQVAVKSISISVEGKGLSGEFTIDDTKSAVVSGTDGVVLNCSSAVTLTSEVASDFNIIIPKGDYENMKIKITAEDGKVVNLVGESVINILRSGITKINIALKAADFNNSLEVITFSESDVEFTER